MVRSRVAALLTGLAVAATLATRPPGAHAAAPAATLRPVQIAVIVNTDAPVVSLTRDDVRRIYLLRTRFWRGGTRIAAANLASSSPLRDAFSRAVLGQSAHELAAYWNDLYFHGTLPPPTVESEAAMLLYVARTPGAIGYVTADALTGQSNGVRVVLSIEGNVP